MTEQGDLAARTNAPARAVQVVRGRLTFADMSALLTPMADGAVLAASPVVVVQEDVIPAYDPDQHDQPDRED